MMPPTMVLGWLCIAAGVLLGLGIAIDSYRSSPRAQARRLLRDAQARAEAMRQSMETHA